jgi:hypothetical protein
MTAGPTVEQLRADIDSGRTGDKVPSHDPAATPLGTDDEAGGTSLSPEVIAQAKRGRVPDSALHGSWLPLLRRLGPV